MGNGIEHTIVVVHTFVDFAQGQSNGEPSFVCADSFCEV